MINFMLAKSITVVAINEMSCRVLLLKSEMSWHSLYFLVGLTDPLSSKLHGIHLASIYYTVALNKAIIGIHSHELVSKHTYFFTSEL